MSADINKRAKKIITLPKILAILSVQIQKSSWDKSVVRSKPKPVTFLDGEPSRPYSSPALKVGDSVHIIMKQ